MALHIIDRQRIGVTVALVLFTLASFRFYSYIHFNTQLLSAVYYVTQVAMLAYCARTVFESNGNTAFGIMRMILLISWFSLIPAWAFWNQSLFLGVVATTFLSVISVYFFLWKHDFDESEMVKFTLFLGLLYVVLWLYSLTNLPMMTFGVQNGDETTLWNDERGMLRINFVGRTSLVLAYFLALNRCFIKKSYTWGGFAAFLFVMIVLQLTRQIIFCAGAVTLVYIFVKSKRLAGIIAGACLAFYLFSVSISFDRGSVVGSMIELTRSQTKYKKQKGDARLEEYPFFFTEYSKNFITDIIGNGVAYSTSPYGRVEEMQKSKGYFKSDVGYAAMFAYTGYVGLALYVFLFIYCIRRKVHPRLEYTLLFMGYMIVVNIAGSWYMTADGQIALASCVYLISKYSRGRYDDDEKEEESELALTDDTEYEVLDNHTGL